MRRSGLAYFVGGILAVVLIIQLIWWVLTPLYDMLWRSIAWIILAIGLLPVWAFVSSGLKHLRSRWHRPKHDKGAEPIGAAGTHVASKSSDSNRHGDGSPSRD